MKGAIAVFGNLSIDDLVFVDGTTRWNIPGGNAMYAGCGISVWSNMATLVAPVGPDYPKEMLERRMSLSRCPRLPRTLRNWGLYEEDGSRQFVFRRATSQWEAFSPTPESALQGSQVAAHVAPMPRQVAMSIILALRSTKTGLISVDLDERDLKQPDLRLIAEMMAACDLFLPSRQEAHAIFPSAEPLEALRRLREMAPETRLIAVKCGADGVIGHPRGASEYIHVPAVPVEPVDVTGGGDSFCGGLLAGFTQKGDAVDALIDGVVSASFCVEGLGPECLLTATREQAMERAELVRQRVVLRQF